MALKQPNKIRVELGDLEHGGHDYDGNPYFIIITNYTLVM